MKIARPLMSLLALIALATATAQSRFEPSDWAVSEFRDAGTLEETCAAPDSSSFWCALLEDELTRIPTKGVDYFFDQSGHLVAIFSKQQKGQRLRSYSVGAGQNLIPSGSAVPGGAVLVAGEFLDPEEAEASWILEDKTTYLGTFRYQVGDVAVEKRIRVSNVSHTLRIELTVTRLPTGTSAEPGEAEATASEIEELVVQYVFPGIARKDNPIVKVGRPDRDPRVDPELDETFSDPLYISFQTDNSRGQALVMRPGGSSSDGLVAQRVAIRGIAMQKALGPSDEQVSFDLEVYSGPNELVRFYQEEYDQLPGLFRPNILGRLSIGIIWVLQFIHEYVPSWGLSIIVLTLLFRALIWPLISTQTRSMYGMQQLQPKIQALQKKYKDDREKLTQETMKLYREAGVNPAGGCLPILLQMPLFIILWRVFVNFEFNEGFLWLPDLGQPDPIYIMPILYVGVMLAQSYFSAKGNPSSLRQQVIINLVFAFIILSFPAGVILYFVVSMLVQVVQYWLISRNRPAPAPAKAK